MVADEHRVKGRKLCGLELGRGESPTSDPVSTLCGAVAKNRRVERREGERA